MRKTYPYLQNPYSPDLNDESKKRRFLKYVDDFVNQRQYVKMTLLDWEENPIKSIEGIISSGSISKDGNSSVRRTCSLSCSVDGESYNVDNMDMDFTLNRKIFIEVGIKNDSPYYKEYPILWFPQGIFFITSFSMNSSTTTAVNLSIGLKDKMAMLNGDIGGQLRATTRFDIMTTQLATGEEVDQKVLIYNLIIELVNHFGGEDLNNIIIEDVPLRIRAIMRWMGENPLYGTVQGIDSESSGTPEQWVFDVTPSESWEDNYFTFDYGEDVGYIYQDFVVGKELYGAPGDSVCSILDQIKSLLGNYEYFYDEMGIFHFREIKNFLNVTQAEFVLDEMSENDYLVETNNEKAIYAFDDNSNITSITVTPKYDNIKNDFLVHGLRPGDDKDSASLVLYHLVIDKKPEIVGMYNNKPFYGEINSEGEIITYENVVCYTDLDGLNKLAILDQTTYNNFSDLPAVGNFNVYYYVKKDEKVYYWDNTLYKELVFIEINEETKEKKEISLGENSQYFYKEYYPRDWRTFLYLKGLQAQALGTDAGPYFEELVAFWPKEYDLRHEVQDWYALNNNLYWSEPEKNNQNKKSYAMYAEGNYFLDFIDTNSELEKYSVSAIGRRSDVVQSDDINCIFEPRIPNIIFLNIDYPEDNLFENTMADDDIREREDEEKDLLRKAQAYCNEHGHPWTQVRENVYSNLTIGGYFNSAYERIKYELFYHTNYQKTISLTSIPVYYLEPNSRVTINDASTNTYGNFMVQSINLTFGPGANMAVTLNEIHERL